MEKTVYCKDEENYEKAGNIQGLNKWLFRKGRLYESGGYFGGDSRRRWIFGGNSRKV